LDVEKGWLFQGWDIPGLGLKDRGFGNKLGPLLHILEKHRYSLFRQTPSHSALKDTFLTGINPHPRVLKGVFLAEMSRLGGPVWGLGTVRRTDRTVSIKRCFTLLRQKVQFWPTPRLYRERMDLSQQDSRLFSLIRAVSPVPNCDTGPPNLVFLAKTG